MLFRNATTKDRMVPFIDKEHPNTPARHLVVKVGEDIDLPEKVGVKFGFTPLSMFNAKPGVLKTLPDPAEINKRLAQQKGRDKPKNPSRVQHGGEKPVPDEVASAESE